MKHFFFLSCFVQSQQIVSSLFPFLVWRWYSCLMFVSFSSIVTKPFQETFNVLSYNYLTRPIHLPHVLYISLVTNNWQCGGTYLFKRDIYASWLLLADKVHQTRDETTLDIGRGETPEKPFAVNIIKVSFNLLFIEYI